MRRIQVDLGAHELGLLDAEARVTGASRSELIRRAIRHEFGGFTTSGDLTREERLEVLRRTAGAWKDWDQDGAEYVDSIRERPQ